MATYAIGDVQGCFQELQRLLGQVHFSSQDTLWLTGDLVNRGPESLATLRFARWLGERCVLVLGNHDLHLLAVAYGKTHVRPADTFQDILNAPDREELLAWLRTRPLLHVAHEQGFAMCHAGILPCWTLKEAQLYAEEVSRALAGKDFLDYLTHLYGNTPVCWQEVEPTGFDRLRFFTNVFTRMRFVNEVGCLDLHAKWLEASQPGFQPWYELNAWAKQDCQVVFGHWAALQGQTNHPFIHAVDTGCGWGEALTALRLEDGQRFSVSSLQGKI